jgi:tetratricopeptide (TPR) repeat protein
MNRVHASKRRVSGLGVVLWLLSFMQPSDFSTSQAAQQPAEITPSIDKLLASGKFAEAESLVKQFLLRQPPSAEVLLEIGRIYFEHDQWKPASDLLRRSLGLQDRNDVAHLLLGLSLAELKQFDESERELQIAVQQNPQSDLNWYFAGWRLLLRGKYEASLPYFYKAVELNPKNPNAHRALGSALARTGSYGLAESYYQKALELLEQDKQRTPEPYLDIAYLLLLGNQKESAARALEYSRKAIALSGQMAGAHYLAGKALLKLERYAEARSELLTAAKLNPKDARPYFLLAQANDGLGEPDQARQARLTFSRMSQRRSDESQGMEALQH